MSCPDCITGGLLPGEPTGTLTTHGAYLAPAPSSEGSDSKCAVVLLTDVFGLPLKNCKIIADNLAKRLNCDVWVPDYFAGTYMLFLCGLPVLMVLPGNPVAPLSMLELTNRAGSQKSIFDRLKFVLKLLPRIPALISNRASIVDARVSEVLPT
jgi:hypothetical protein